MAILAFAFAFAFAFGAPKAFALAFAFTLAFGGMATVSTALHATPLLSLVLFLCAWYPWYPFQSSPSLGTLTDLDALPLFLCLVLLEVTQAQVVL